MHQIDKKPSLDTAEDLPGIFRLTHNQHVYSWLVAGSKQSLLIDTGWGMSDLRARVETLVHTPITVANTHGHFDHTFGNYQFDEVYLSAEDSELAMRACSPDSRIERSEGFDLSALPGGLSADEWIGAAHPRILRLEDGEIFDLGNRTIETIKTPGHTAGSVCFLDTKGKVLFTGDTIYRGYLLLHFDTSTELSVYRSSLETIVSRKKDYDWILPAHGRAPLKAEFAKDVLDGVEKILKGKNPGEKHTFRGRKCLISRFDDFFIVHKDETA